MVEAKNYRAQSDSRVGLWANFKGRQKLDSVPGREKSLNKNGQGSKSGVEQRRVR